MDIIWTREAERAVFHVSLPPGDKKTIELWDQDRFLRNVVLPTTKMRAVVSFSHPVDSSNYFYVKERLEPSETPLETPEYVVRYVHSNTVRAPLNKLTSVVDSLTDGYVSFTRSALEQIDSLLSNL